MTEEIKEKKELEEIPPIPRETMYEMIRRAESPRDKGLIASFFLLGNRCTEGLMFSRKDVTRECSMDVFDQELNSLISQLGRLRTEIDIGEKLGRDMDSQKEKLGMLFDEYQEMNLLRASSDKQSLRKAIDEISMKYPQTQVYVVKILTLKRKKRIPRYIPIPMIDPVAPFFVQQLEDRSALIFGISRQRVWQIFDRLGVYAFYKDHGYPVPKNPFRHARLSEVSNFLLDPQLYRFAGWKIRGTSDAYVHLKWEDFVPALVGIARSAPLFKEEG